MNYLLLKRGIRWIGVLLKSRITVEELSKKVPFLDTLIKKEKDMEIVLEKLKNST